MKSSTTLGLAAKSIHLPPGSTHRQEDKTSKTSQHGNPGERVGEKISPLVTSQDKRYYGKPVFICQDLSSEQVKRTSSCERLRTRPAGHSSQPLSTKKHETARTRNKDCKDDSLP